MTRDEAIATIREFLVDEFEIEASLIEPTANVQETLDLDSLDYVDLVVIMESNFGFKVKPEDFTNIVTFDDFYDFVCEKIDSK